MSVMILLPEPKTMKIEMFHCPHCKQSFYYDKYLKRHMKRMHGMNLNKISNKVHKCNLCDKSFTTKRYMYKHRMIAHKVSSRRNSIKCQEENCNDEFSTLAKFRNHLDCVHNFADYNVPEKLRFSSLAEYFQWLVREEQNTKCKFIRPRGRFKRTSYTGIDYTCIQNRYFFPKALEKNMPKIQDPTSTRYHCTSQILVREYGHYVEALYFKRHYKHVFSTGSPKLFIRRKKNKKVEKKLDSLANICEAAFSLTEKQCSSGSEDANITNFPLCNSDDVCVQSLTKQVDTVRSKLLSKTSIDFHIAENISKSLKAVEKLLDNDNPPNNIVSSCAINEVGKFVDELFVSTTSANDHDYNKM